MSVLSRNDLVGRLANKNLIVTPLLHAKQIGKSAIDLRMGNVVKLVRSRGLPYVDPRSYEGDDNAEQVFASHKLSRQKLERHDIPFKRRFILHPGTLALVPALEWVQLPHDLQGVVTARSSWAREGLSIATATFIEPGFSGVITLELANLGVIPMMLYPGLRIAQIAFYQASGVPADGPVKKSSQFQNNYEPRAGRLWSREVDPFIDESTP